MNKDWKISLAGAVVLHVAALYGVHVTLHKPARLLNDSAVEVTLVAAPAPMPMTEPAPPVETPPQPPPPPEVKPPEPLPVETKPVEVPVEPVATAPAPVVAAVPTPAPSPPPVVGNNTSPVPAQDRTTAQAQPGERARVNYRRNPKPVYPSAARKRGQAGVVSLSVRVTAEGRAARVEIKESSGYPLLDESALKAVRDWEFEPARIGSLAVESDIEVPVRFRLTD